MNFYKVTNYWFHDKNSNGLNLLNAKNWSGENDGIIFLSMFDMNIINNYDRVICGPHVDFHKCINFINTYKGPKKILYNTLSKWNLEFHTNHSNKNDFIKIITLPFPVDVNKYVPAIKTDNVFIYFKNVHSNKLKIVTDMLSNYKNFDFNKCKIFTYGSYNSDDYLNYIKTCKYGIWVGRHESQGFAFQEALSCDCPLFVFDVHSLKEEYDNGKFPWQDIIGDCHCTSASYFDNRCGLIYKNDINSDINIINNDIINDILSYFIEFLNKLDTYKPREFILENLSPDVIKQQIYTLFDN